jgi:hypothetical protein
MRLLHLQLIEPIVTTVQAGILIGRYLGGEGDVRGKHIYIGISRLHAQVIRIWEISDSSTIVTREIRRRTWLSVVIAEKWSAADMAFQPAVFEEYNDLLPFLDDIVFISNQPSIQESDSTFQSPIHGLWAQMAGSVDIFRQISSIIQNLGSSLRSIQSYQQEIRLLDHRLDQWVEGLPADLAYSKANLAYFARAGLGWTFLSMHIGYNHHRQLLYYPFLNPRQGHQSDEPFH